MLLRLLQPSLWAFLISTLIRTAISVDSPPVSPPALDEPITLDDSPIRWTEVFKYKDTLYDGGCRAYTDLITQYWAETQMFLYAAIDALADAIDGSPVALAHLKAYFGVRRLNDRAFRVVTEYLAAVLDFVNMESDRWINHSPWLFCDSTFMRPGSREEEALNSQGAPLVVYSDGTEHNPKVEECPAYHHLMWLDNGRPHPTNGVYWAPDLHLYFFFEPGWGSEVCSAGTNQLGATADEEAIHVVYLCPLAFTTPMQPAALGGVPLVPGRHVTEIAPRSTTLYHELIHISLGTFNTPDAAYDFNEMREALESPSIVPPTVKINDPELVSNDNLPHWNHRDLIGRNPETYVLFSVAYWATQHTNLDWTSGYGIPPPS